MNRKASFNAIASIIFRLPDDEQLAIVEQPKRFRELMVSLAAEVASSTFVVSIDDKDVPEQYMVAVKCWRMYAAEFNYAGPVAWKVKDGFSLKINAPLVGPCYRNLKDIQKWDIQNDEPTKNSIVFWVPRLASVSMDRTFTEMEMIRDLLKKRLELPNNHATSFGSISLLFALILAHFKRKGERVPLKNFFAISDSVGVEGNRLIVGDFGGSGLQCSDTVGRPRYDLGFFLLGVDLL